MVSSGVLNDCLISCIQLKLESYNIIVASGIVALCVGVLFELNYIYSLPCAFQEVMIQC